MKKSIRNLALSAGLTAAAAFSAKAQKFSYEQLERNAQNPMHNVVIGLDLQKNHAAIFPYPDARMANDTTLVRTVQFVFKNDGDPAKAIVRTNRLGLDDDYLNLKETYVDANQNGTFEANELAERDFLSFNRIDGDNMHMLQIFQEFEDGKIALIETSDRASVDGESVRREKDYPDSKLKTGLAETTATIGDLFNEQWRVMNGRLIAMNLPPLERPATGTPIAKPTDMMTRGNQPQ